MRLRIHIYLMTYNSVVLSLSEVPSDIVAEWLQPLLQIREIPISDTISIHTLIGT
jgi:hypothetical protein